MRRVSVVGVVFLAGCASATTSTPWSATADLRTATGQSVGQTVPEQLRLDLDLEKAAIKRLNTGIETCRGLGDNGSRELLEDILEGEEAHANWIEAQLALIAQVGEANYLAQQIVES